MAEYSVLIAESSEELGRALEEKLNRFCRVTVCGTGEQALEALRLHCPDVLVTELMLPGMDGISFLKAVEASGRRPAILALTDFVSPYILSAAQSLGAVCVFEKPCSPEAVSDRVLQLLRSHSCREQQTRCSRVTGLLQELGFSAKLRGYSYLREAILQMAENPDRSIVKELYSSVGAVYGVTARHVEHSARCAIREAWSRGDPDLWALYFGEGRPTSAAFIGTLAAGLSGQEPERRKMAAGQN